MNMPMAPGGAPSPMAQDVPTDTQTPAAPSYDMNALYSPYQEIAAVLWLRIDHLQPSEIAALDRVITPDTAPVLMKIFPELAPLIEQGSALQQPGGPAMGQMPAGQPPAMATGQPQVPTGPAPMPAPQMAAPGGPAPMGGAAPPRPPVPPRRPGLAGQRMM